MKKKLIVFFSLSLTVFSLSTQAKIFTGTIDKDTAMRSVSRALPYEIAEPLVVVKKANVVFPAILSQHASASIHYIENFSVQRKKYITFIYKKSKAYFPKVEKILDQYNIPREFKVLMAIESGFRSNAVSPAGAVGYWQFMNDVALEYGLKVKSRAISKKTGHPSHKKINSTDDRMDFDKSTHAAARYLLDRSKNLNNDWLLVAASYNCGIGNVWKAMKKTGKSNASFWEVKNYLPKETQQYVMNFITLNVMLSNFDKYAEGELCFRDEYSGSEEINAIFRDAEMQQCLSAVALL